MSTQILINALETILDPGLMKQYLDNLKQQVSNLKEQNEIYDTVAKANAFLKRAEKTVDENVKELQEQRDAFLKEKAEKGKFFTELAEKYQKVGEDLQKKSDRLDKLDEMLRQRESDVAVKEVQLTKFNEALTKKQYEISEARAQIADKEAKLKAILGA